MRRGASCLVTLAVLAWVGGCSKGDEKLCTGNCGGPDSSAGGDGGTVGIAGSGGTNAGGSGGANVGGSGGLVVSGAGGALAAGGGGALGGAGGIAPNCGILNHTAMALAPDILILLDRSGSMSNDINDQTCMSIDPTTGAIATRDCGPQSKWALVTPVIEQVVTASESTVNWGLKYFADPGNSACNVNNNVQVASGPGNATAVASAIAAETNAQGGLSNGSRTPTRVAVQAAATYLASLSDPSTKLILLATDGLPNCAPGTSGTTDDSTGAIAAVQAAATAGIKTFVVGVATAGGVADATLSQLALAGGFARAGDPSYYPVSTAAELTAALEALIDASKQPCMFALPPPPTQNGTTSRERINVYADGVPLGRSTSHAEGWDYTDGNFSAITVYGAACAGLKNGTITTVTIAFVCLGGP